MSSEPENSEEACGLAHAPRAPIVHDEATLERAAILFKAMGDTGRLRILAILSEREVCVTELAAVHNEQLSTVSQRLRHLNSVGLVSRRREGRHIFYGVHDLHVGEIVKAALDHAIELHADQTRRKER